MADTNGRGGGSRGSASVSRSQSQSQSRSPTVPPRAVRGLPDNFSRESGHPATSSGTRSTHFFGSSGLGTGGSASTVANQSSTAFRNSSSPPQSSSIRRGIANDEGSLVDFLGTSETGMAGQDRGATGSGSTADGADRFGLFTASGGTTTSSGSRVAQSRARYDTLFGEENGTSTTTTTRRTGTSRRRTDTSSLFGEDDFR